ncbi:MAG TPA: PilZ domain-containing protein [Desulfomonilaceae bacterium]|nr:PilZ domain-containing protein [Desulfomonilaceae bacterium]
MADTEQRKFTRVLFETEITITAGNETATSRQLRDISMGGASFEIDGVLSVGTECLLQINLVGPASHLRIQVEGEVLRQEANAVAVGFTRIDLDSLIHLRHLIRIHSSDPETIEQEYRTSLLEIS